MIKFEYKYKDPNLVRMDSLVPGDTFTFANSDQQYIVGTIKTETNGLHISINLKNGEHNFYPSYILVIKTEIKAEIKIP